MFGSSLLFGPSCSAGQSTSTAFIYMYMYLQVLAHIRNNCVIVVASRTSMQTITKVTGVSCVWCTILLLTICWIWT